MYVFSPVTARGKKEENHKAAVNHDTFTRLSLVANYM
jgi:hypothetical protein